MLLRKQVILDRFEGKQAVFTLENGQEFRLLKEEVGEAEAGQNFVFQILPEAEAALERNDLARSLLNQVLNAQDQVEPSSY